MLSLTAEKKHGEARDSPRSGTAGQLRLAGARGILEPHGGGRSRGRRSGLGGIGRSGLVLDPHSEYASPS